MHPELPIGGWELTDEQLDWIADPFASLDPHVWVQRGGESLFPPC